MAVDLKGLSEALNYESKGDSFEGKSNDGASIQDGTSNTVLLSERYDQSFGDPVTFTYTVTTSVEGASGDFFDEAVLLADLDGSLRATSYAPSDYYVI